MKFLVATIFIALIAIAMAHPPADEVKPENEQKEQQEQKPIDEAAPAPVETPSDEKLPVKIYYEGLCPDSRKLMHELGMDYYTFRKYINLDFIPFGRAKSLDADGNGFECHHGPAECVANIVHSCGIQYLKSVDAKQQFVVCQMRTEAEVTGKACFEEAGGDWTEASKCIEGDEGKKLQLKAEVDTKEISVPRLENVPTVVFNNKYDLELNNKALKGFKIALCEMLKAKNIPECA